MVEYEEIPKDCLLKFFPRNLSYTEQLSFLDNFSTCFPFVRENRRQKHVNGSPLLDGDFYDSEDSLDTDMSDDITLGPDEVKVGLHDSLADHCPLDGPPHGLKISLDHSDVTSEEGVFVNMMDDLDSVESSNGNGVGSVGSDLSYFSLDDVGSPTEEDNKTLQQELNEAVYRKLENSQHNNVPNSNEVDGHCDKEGKNGVAKSDIKTKTKANNYDFGAIGTDVDAGMRKVASLKIELNSGSFLDRSSHKYLLEVPESPVYDDPEFNINKAELRKSSSLKCTKTPPGTPRRKKMVRFADVMGLDLESIRHVLNTELPPRVPNSAMKDLQIGVQEDRKDVGSRYLSLCFPQPGVEPSFVQRVIAEKVMLENCVITDMSITGVVRVANIGFHKSVRLRYSINNWVSFYDIMASYIQNSCDGPTDRFSFNLVAPSAVGPGSKIAFAVSYTVNDTIYWDNNGGRNYEVECFAKTTPTALDDGWVHFV